MAAIVCRLATGGPDRWLASPAVHAAESSGQQVDPLLEDATLWDVCFVDETTGWAVGDRGAIWHTADGGTSWRLQTSPARVPLLSVDFADKQNGWIAGGAALPYSAVSEGLLLRTSDGGQHWNLSGDTLQPRRTGVSSFGAAAVTWGSRGDLFPTGLFGTQDGGRGWTPLPTDVRCDWSCGAFLGPLHGVLAGDDGVACMRDGTVRWATVPKESGPRRRIRDMLFAGHRGWLVGDGGLILTTDDAGMTWKPPSGRMPPWAGSVFDFRAVAANGDQVWIAGSPGSVVFHSQDGGAHWQARMTTITVPIQGLCMLASGHGWAVGSLGTILMTRDGGQTWAGQKGTAERVALLGIFATPRDIPLETLSDVSAAKGYRAAVCIVSQPRDQTDFREGLEQRSASHEAVLEVGGCEALTAWEFTVQGPEFELPAASTLQNFQRDTESRGLANLDQYLVRQIRIWRPSVVLTHGAERTGVAPALEQFVGQAVLRAVEQAADERFSPALTDEAGLPLWSVTRLFGTCSEEDSPHVETDTFRLEPRLGKSTAEHATRARGLVGLRYRPPAESIGYRCLIDKTDEQRAVRDFFRGISVSSGVESKRPLKQEIPFSLDALKRSAEKRRNLTMLLKQTDDPSTWLGQLEDLTGELDAAGGSMIFELAHHQAYNGRWEFAAELFERMIERYPDHPLVESAIAWLIGYLTSGEADWQATRRKSNQGSPLQRALAWNHRLQRTRPRIYFDPAFGLPLAAAARKAGDVQQADKQLRLIGRGRLDDAWFDCVAAERWVAEPRGVPKKPVWSVRRTAEAPLLDGKLDEPCWMSAAPVPLNWRHTAAASPPAELWISYDAEYLYVAARCPHAAASDGKQRPAPAGRPRDGDLSGHDRVELLLDIDRDYTSFYQFSFDERGWCRDECLGDASWNPAWYVAHDADAERWSVEAAVPLEELVGEVPSRGTVWAAGCLRIVPGMGLQSWSEPAGIPFPGQGCGLLVFE